MVWLNFLLLLVPLLQSFHQARASLIDDIIDALEGAVDCAGCHALLLPLKGLALLGDSAFSGTLNTVCTTLKLQDSDVCKGAIGGPGVVLAQGLRNIDPFGQTSTKLCNGLVGLCPSPKVNAYTVPFPKPAPTNPKTFTSKGNKPFQVVHFSDVHIDRQYTVGAEANCTKPICCRNYADHTGPVEIPAEPNGNRKCDTPTSLAQSLLNAIKANNMFSIFTGDVVEAAVWLVTKDEVTSDIDAFNDQMANTLQGTVYPAVGNHEAAPVNNFPRNTTKDHAQDLQYVFDATSAGWQRWIGSSAADQVKHISGSYSTIVSGTNLMIISLNTVYWYKLNFWLYDSNQQQPDPNGILSFLVSQLQAAEDAGQRAWIIGHMPPGIADTFDDQSNYYDQVVQRYKNTIAGQFFGHTHADEFEIAYSDYNKRTKDTATGIVWIAPALTPRSGNPAFKVYDIDPDTYEVMDAKVYSADLNDPNFQTTPNWALLYSARTTYGSLLPTPLPPTDSLNPAFWHQVTEGFEKNDAAFQQYDKFKKRVGPGRCNEESNGGTDAKAYASCKNTTICGLRAARSQNNCVVPKPGLNLSRRDESEAHGDEAHAVTGECESTSVGHVLQQLSILASNNKFDAETKELLRERLKEVLPAEAVEN
uniref:Calcineurin-like phosphoesterase domain-containing protein n=1 Tax=Moniliophthora roreri TaxID=221103 RepID=A0A0W0GDV1_MONRR